MVRTFALLAALSASLCVHAQTDPAAAPAANLRALLQQKPAAGAAAVRELSAEQRAELRRQVLQAREPAGKRP